MRVATTLILLALSAFSSVALAGFKGLAPVYIIPGYFQGGLSTARYTSNATEYIYCDMQASGFVQCLARDAAGATASCTTDTKTQPELGRIIAGLNSASLLYIYWDTATGACTTVTVRNGSYLLP